MVSQRNLAVVLSGGGMNGILLELGFLRRLRDDPELWSRVGWIYGTSAGALAGAMAAWDRLDELERFLLGLRPEETFRPNPLWQTPLTGLHEYRLPRTIADRLGPAEQLVAGLRDAPIELVVSVTDVSDGVGDDDPHAFERTFSSRTTPPELMGRAVLASAAVSALVLPVVVGDTIGTDGGWVRNFPLGHAYDNHAVEEIVAFRYRATYPQSTGENLVKLRRRLERFRAVPPVRAVIGELHAAEERRERGEPAHLPDMLVRLMRVTISRNTALEERHAADGDQAVSELAELRRDTAEIVRRYALPWRRTRALAELEARFDDARFPFRHRRRPAVTVVRGGAGASGLDPSFRAGLEWPDDAKSALIERGYALTDEALRNTQGEGVGGETREAGR
jgi:predicted acylesterase/phospholipase RssA